MLQAHVEFFDAVGVFLVGGFSGDEHVEVAEFPEEVLIVVDACGDDAVVCGVVFKV